jgi:hypothetical protein
MGHQQPWVRYMLYATLAVNGVCFSVLIAFFAAWGKTMIDGVWSFSLLQSLSLLGQVALLFAPEAFGLSVIMFIFTLGGFGINLWILIIGWGRLAACYPLTEAPADICAPDLRTLVQVITIVSGIAAVVGLISLVIGGFWIKGTRDRRPDGYKELARNPEQASSINAAHATAWMTEHYY